MSIVLKKGAWREFKIVLLLKGFAEHWDPNIIRKIFMILQTEEIRERFLSPFPPLRSDEKLDLSLDEIINPIEVLEERSHTRGCHPGRLTLDPDRYHRAFTGDDTIVPHHMRAGFISTPWGKHRLLDRNENHNPHLQSLIKQQDGRITWGLQDLYFMGGVPLMYWRRGDSMGMWVPQNPPDSRNFQWTSTVFYPEDPDEDMGRTRGGWRTYCFKRMWYLPTEMSWWGRGVGWPWIPLHERRPRTWFGNEEWVRRRPGLDEPVGPADKSNIPYVSYIQLIEDFSKVAKFEGSGIHGLEFDEYCSWMAKISDFPQPITLGGAADRY